MNKLVAALEWIRNECSPPVHAAMDDMPTINACWQVADTALSEHRAEPSADVVERVKLGMLTAAGLPSDAMYITGRAQSLAESAIAAMQGEG